MSDFPSGVLRDSEVDELVEDSPLVADDSLRKTLQFCDLNGLADSETVRNVIRSAASERATEAVSAGNNSVISYLTGLRESRIETAEVHGLMQLLKRTRTAGYLATFFGATNAGKTNLALLMAELSMQDNPDMQLVTNITSVRGEVPESRLHVVEDWTAFDRGIHTLKDLGAPWFAILDEFSSHGSGYSTDAGDVEEKMRLTARWLAKGDGRLVPIGHDGKDVHPTLREFSRDIIWLERKETPGLFDPDDPPEYRASFYEGVSDREPFGLRFELGHVPETSWDYNPDESTSWSWL